MPLAAREFAIGVLGRLCESLLAPAGRVGAGEYGLLGVLEGSVLGRVAVGEQEGR